MTVGVLNVFLTDKISCRFIVLIKFYVFLLLHTYHSRYIPEGVAGASQIFLRDAQVLPKLILAISNTADVTGGKPIAV
jgi:hypothetical protein